MKKLLSFIAIVLLLTACGGDWTITGSPDADGAVFSRSYRYYYVKDCRYDSIVLYDCSLSDPVSPAYTASLRIDSDDLATLTLDGARAAMTTVATTTSTTTTGN